MKLCIPATEAQGLQSKIEPHFPHAFTLQFFDTESRIHKEIRVGDPSENRMYGPVDTILCGTINLHGMQQLQRQGIQVMATNAQTVADAIAQFERGELRPAEALGGCGSHNHGDEEHQCCGGGQGNSHNHEGSAHACCGGGRQQAGDLHAHEENRHACGGHGGCGKHHNHED